MMVAQTYETPAARFVKWGIPKASTLFAPLSAQSLLRAAEIGCQILQGKGAGSGWDIDAETKAALRFIPDQAIIFDVGANHGDWSNGVTKGLADRYSPPAQLFLIEPQATCKPFLDPIIDDFSAKWIVAAAGSKPGFTDLYVNCDASGIATIHERRDTYFADEVFTKIQVPVLTIDGIMKQEGVSLIDFMKIDVEGHEYQVLQGASVALGKQAIRSLSFEFGSANLNSRTLFWDFWNYLNGFGYTIHRILPGGRLVPIARYDEQLEHFRGVSNYIASAIDLS